MPGGVGGVGGVGSGGTIPEDCGQWLQPLTSRRTTSVIGTWVPTV